MTGDGPRVYTARDRWHDPELKRWYMLALQARRPGGVSAGELEGMRAELRRETRGGATAEQEAALRERKLAELAAGAEAAGLVPATGGDGDPAVIDTVLRVHLPADGRPGCLVCQMCLRTLRKRGGRRVEVRPRTFTCRCCAGLDQTAPPAVLDMWLLDDRRYKRAAIIATYRVDPATMAAAEVRAEVTRIFEDDGGLPLAAENAAAIPAAALVPVNTWWSQRGRAGTRD